MIISTDAELYINYYSFLIEHKIIPNFYKTYLDHVLNHKQMVYLAWIYVADTLCELNFITETDFIGIDSKVNIHDDSKLKMDEFVPYAKRFNGPKPKDPIVKADFKSAVRLHKTRNLHHYEALKSYKCENWKQYAVELVCDYIAMGWEFDNYICEYFEKVKGELKNDLPEEYYSFIESIINIIPEKLPLAEEPLTENNIEYVYYCFNNHNDPFEEYENESKVRY